MENHSAVVCIIVKFYSTEQDRIAHRTHRFAIYTQNTEKFHTKLPLRSSRFRRVSVLCFREKFLSSVSFSRSVPFHFDGLEKGKGGEKGEKKDQKRVYPSLLSVVTIRRKSNFYPLSFVYAFPLRSCINHVAISMPFSRL